MTTSDLRLHAARRLLAGLAMIALAALAAPAGAQVSVTVSGNTAVAQISLAGGYSADLTLTFEGAQNLSAANLGISASTVNPLDPTLLARLPANTSVSVPSAFPVLISVAPPALGGLSFNNGAAVEIHTHNLVYTDKSPLRIYKAPPGGSFYDITNDVASGSVRTRGTTGGFSDFLILVDLQPAHDVAEDKYAFLDARIANSALSNSANSTLSADLSASRNAFDAGDYALANSCLDTFRADLSSYAGNGVPNVWRAARDLDNVAGDLFGESASLQFTLARLAAQ